MAARRPSDELAQTARRIVDSAGAAKDPPAPPLESYLCCCRTDVFLVVAQSYGAAWIQVMRRYGARHPGEIPQPVYMPSRRVPRAG